MRITEINRISTSRRTFIALLAGGLLSACAESKARNREELQYGILVQRYTENELFSENADRAFPAASISKLLVAIAFLERNTMLYETYGPDLEVTKTAFAAVNRFFPSTRPGSHLSPRPLLSHMIEQSDDFSANVIIDSLGVNRINTTAARLGLKVLRVHGRFYDTSAPLTPLGYTTARDCNKMLAHILAAARSGSSQSVVYQRLLASMTRQRDRRFVPSAVPDGTQVANKTGEIHNELNDTAIITPFAKDPILFTILAHGEFNIFGDQGAYKDAVLEVQRYVRSTYDSLKLSA